VRVLFTALLAAAVLALGACGGDDSDDKPSSQRTQTLPPGEDGSAAGGYEGIGGKRVEPGRRNDERSNRSREQRQRSASRPERRFRGIERSNYEISKSVCGSQGLTDAAMRYRAKSERPEDVARAYARISYHVPRLRRAGYAGCLAGLRER
jgi:hypothetical protein